MSMSWRKRSYDCIVAVPSAKIGTTTRHRSDHRQRPGRLHRQCEKLQEWQAIGRVIGVSARQHSSGGKQTLQGISKRVDSYLRTLLFYGARPLCGWQSAKSSSGRLALGEGQRRLQGRKPTAMEKRSLLSQDIAKASVAKRLGISVSSVYRIMP